jgi:hypothetical protein
MDEAGEEDGIGPEAVPRPVDERQLLCLEIYPTQRLVSQTTAQDAVTREAFGREDERPSLPLELADVCAFPAAGHRPA